MGKALSTVLIVCGAREKMVQVGTSINAQPVGNISKSNYLAGFGGVHNVPSRAFLQVAILIYV